MRELTARQKLQLIRIAELEMKIFKHKIRIHEIRIEMLEEKLRQLQERLDRPYRFR